MSTTDTSLMSIRHPALLTIFVGAIVWAVACVVTALTDDTILLPTVILVGSFLVPVAVVVAAFVRAERQGETELANATILLGFLAGGAIGVVFAALLETYLLPTVNGTFLAVGAIEEASKGLVVLLVAWRIQTRRPVEGMVLGAVVGAGFASFESAGYAFDAYIKYGTANPFLDLLQTEFSRALLSPFGHILWSSLLGGALFAACRGKHFRLTAGVIGTYVGVVLLHTAWDACYGVAILITEGVTGDGWDWVLPNAEAWVSSPTRNQFIVFDALYYGFLTINAAIGALWFFRRWRRYSAHTAEGASLGGPTVVH